MQDINYKEKKANIENEPNRKQTRQGKQRNKISI